jgi:hypothetical protein
LVAKGLFQNCALGFDLLRENHVDNDVGWLLEELVDSFNHLLGAEDV